MDAVERAKKLVIPTLADEKKLDEVARKVHSKLEDALGGNSPTPEINLGGSYARGTWLKGSFDIDYFMLYPRDYPREKLETEAVHSAERALQGFKTSLRFAEHPYVEGFVDNVRVNLVPCYKVQQGEWKSAADRSPYHTKYIVSKMDDRLKVEARLFKRFVKAARVYGAEVKVQGFSGYVCEVLVLKFGSFESTLSGIARLGPSEVVSIEPYDRDLASSFKSPMVILDPVDSTRNLGAAISWRNVAKLVLQSRRFLKNPKLSYFQEKNRELKPPKSLLDRTLVVTFGTKWRSPDILWGQLRKSASGISERMESLGFHVLRWSVASDESSKSALVFFFEETSIGELHARKGPEYFRDREIEKYFVKNKRRAILTWLGDEGRLESVFPRESVNALKALEVLLSKKIQTSGISQEIREEIGRGYHVSRGSGVLKKNDWLSKSIRAILTEE